MKNLIRFLVVASFSLLSACALGPLVSHESARTVGDNNHEVMGGYGSGAYFAKWTYGITEDWDLGVQWEALSMGIRTKYAFVNGKQNEFSFAAAAGIGSSIGGSHYYADLIGSYWVGSVEPYLTYRYVHVSTDPVELRDKDTNNVDFTINVPDYNYGQAIGGIRWWLNENWIVSAEVSSLHSLTSGLTIGSNILWDAALGYRFQ